MFENAKATENTQKHGRLPDCRGCPIEFFNPVPAKRNEQPGALRRPWLFYAQRVDRDTGPRYAQTWPDRSGVRRNPVAAPIAVACSGRKDTTEHVFSRIRTVICLIFLHRNNTEDRTRNSSLSAERIRMMKKNIFFLFVLVSLALFGIVSPEPAQAAADQVTTFPENVIVVPKGMQVSVNPDESVTITDCPVSIEAGDTFVVYLQDLPLGYVAETVEEENGQLTINGSHADPDIYSGINQSGKIELTGDMYVFEPASASGLDDPEFTVLDFIKYKDGELTVSVGNSQSKVAVTFSNMDMNFNINGMSVRGGVSGSWKVEFTSSTLMGGSTDEIELGSIHVFGVGKIALKAKISFAGECTFSGSFSSGVDVDNFVATPYKSFSLGGDSFSGGGTVSLSLKMTAGLDFLIAEAFVYTEVGIKTDYRHEHHYHSDREPQNVDCDDFKVYLFSSVGAQVTYLDKNVAEVTYNIADGDNTPFMINYHMENGRKVPYCSEGMDTTTVERKYGGFVTDPDTAFDSLEQRCVYIGIILPDDFEVDGDLYVDDGGIDLNGHTLTINGCLYQSAGLIAVGEGELVVNGDYYMMRDTEDLEPRKNDYIKLSFLDGTATVSGKMFHAQGEVEMRSGTLNVGSSYEMRRENGENHYSDSTGWLTMVQTNGTINIGGDLLLQSNSSNHQLTAGTIHVCCDLTQFPVQERTSHFSSLWNFTVDLVPNHYHTLTFNDPENNALSVLSFDDDIVVNGGLSVGHMELGGHHVVIHGDLIKNNTAYHAEDHVISLGGGILEVDGSFYQTLGGMMLEGGKLDVGGDYIIAYRNEDTESGIYWQDYYTYLTMDDEGSELRIGGDFINAGDADSLKEGTVYIAGDFHDYYGSYSSHDNHCTVFNGIRMQTIAFENANAGFNTVVFENRNICLGGTCLRGFTLNDDLDLKLATRSLELRGCVDLNGHKLNLSRIEGDLTLTGGRSYETSLILNGEPVTVNGDLVLCTALWLNGSEVTVQGNVLQSHESAVNMGAGKLTTAGDYIIANIPEGESQVYDQAYYSYISMEDSAGEIHVSGDFINAGGPDSLREGTIYIAGDFHDYYGSYSSHDNHCTVFNGTGMQTIAFENANAGFNTVVFENRDICLGGTCLRGFTLNEDLNLKLATRSLELRGCVDLNGHKLNLSPIEGTLTLTGGRYYENGLILNGEPVTINGDLVLRTVLWLNGSEVTVQGSVLQSQESAMYIGAGKLTAAGDYIIANIPEGESQVYDQAYYSVMNMEDAAGEIHVGGDFINAGGPDSLRKGTVYIAGDFYDYYGSYSAHDNHCTVFNGTGMQTIAFENRRGQFNTVVLDQPLEQYGLPEEIRWQKLVLSCPPTFGSPTFVIPEHTVEIGESVFEGISASVVSVPSGCERIGDYAFRNSALTRIRLPGSCEIQLTAFDGCGLVLVYSSSGSTAESVCEQLPNCVFIPESVSW